MAEGATRAEPHASDTSEPDAGEARTPVVLAPWTSFASCILLIVFALAVRHALGAGPLARMADALPGEAAAFAVRTLEDPARLGLVLAVLTVALYAGLQHLALSADIRTARRLPGGRFSATGRWLRLLAGRHDMQARRGDLAQIAEWGADTLFEPMRLGIAAFPMVGFLGTVIGLSGAIASLPAAIGDKAALDAVLADLHVAFDTTLLGLLGALVCLIACQLGEAGTRTLQRSLT